jgi:hypothetical protein
MPVASLRPGSPNILIYIQEIGKIAADPNGAAETVLSTFGDVLTPSPPQGTTG